MSETHTDYQVFIDRRRLPSGVVFWSDAKNHVGKTVSIYGPVKSTYFDWKDYERNIAVYTMGVDPKPTFIEVGEKYPDKNLVKIVIWGRDRKLFQTPPDVLYRDQTIVFTSKPYVYNGIVTVQVSSPASIRIAEPSLVESIEALYDIYDCDMPKLKKDPNYILVTDATYEVEERDDRDVPTESDILQLYPWMTEEWHFDEDNGWLDYYPEK